MTEMTREFNINLRTWQIHFLIEIVKLEALTDIGEEKVINIEKVCHVLSKLELYDISFTNKYLRGTITLRVACTQQIQKKVLCVKWLSFLYFQVTMKSRKLLRQLKTNTNSFRNRRLISVPGVSV